MRYGCWEENSSSVRQSAEDIQAASLGQSITASALSTYTGIPNAGFSRISCVSFLEKVMSIPKTGRTIMSSETPERQFFGIRRSTSQFTVPSGRFTARQVSPLAAPNANTETRPSNSVY